MKRDPIEQTEEFKEALARIQPELDAIRKELDETGIGMGISHIYWARKKELLKKQGIDWKTPAECNPYIIFD
jgi:hypothetical protein